MWDWKREDVFGGNNDSGRGTKGQMDVSLHLYAPSLQAEICVSPVTQPVSSLLQQPLRSKVGTRRVDQAGLVTRGSLLFPIPQIARGLLAFFLSFFLSICVRVWNQGAAGVSQEPGPDPKGSRCRYPEKSHRPSGRGRALCSCLP